MKELYRKKPALVEAIKFDNTEGNLEELEVILNDKIYSKLDENNTMSLYIIPRAEDMDHIKIAKLGDYIIKEIVNDKNTKTFGRPISLMNLNLLYDKI